MITREISPGFRQRFDEARNGGGGAFDFGNALMFDGTNDVIVLDTKIIEFDLVGATMSIWLKPSAVPSFKYFFGESTNFWIQLNQSGGVANRIRVSGATNFEFATGMNINGWNNVVITRQDSDDNWRCYLNSVEATNSPLVNSEKFEGTYIGDRSNNTSPFAGVIDEFAFWEGVIATQQNVTDLYNVGSGALASDIIPNPNRFYRFNESSGTTLTDIGSDLVNGVLTNFADPDSNWQAH